MSDTTSTPARTPLESGPAPRVVESPPPSAQPARESMDDGPRVRLHQLARELVRVQNRRLLVEYLQLRRALR